ncbi:hypothetical protein ACTTAK_18165 (plasmid) [Rhodobacter capsulatus]|nr:hypothetical protein [Rhodobacter capsulatus]
MPKGKSHSNREAKKPKQPKKPAAAKQADLFTKGAQPGMGEKKKP